MGRLRLRTKFLIAMLLTCAIRSGSLFTFHRG